jgi:hypothetical protein
VEPPVEKASVLARIRKCPDPASRVLEAPVARAVDRRMPQAATRTRDDRPSLARRPVELWSNAHLDAKSRGKNWGRFGHFNRSTPSEHLFYPGEGRFLVGACSRSPALREGNGFASP